VRRRCRLRRPRRHGHPVIGPGLVGHSDGAALAYVWHGLVVDGREFVSNGGGAQEFVSSPSRFIKTLGAKRHADPLLGPRGVVDGVVAPVSAVVVPDVVVWFGEGSVHRRSASRARMPAS